ncbi:helix-turn-helix domain-containing protein [Hoeflea alexandrii]|uniref:helix-turn-helix domain-containing protein n=1 Tax=Hoeflea alexandrii TaxID=288436 RepID=UPI0035CF531E
MHGTTSKVDPKVKEQSAIKARLLTAGITLAEIDRTYGLSDGTARNTMREPNVRGERAIAAALGTQPHLLWRTRYRPSGQRRSPQDWTRVPTLKQRRNEQAA